MQILPGTSGQKTRETQKKLAKIQEKLANIEQESKSLSVLLMAFMFYYPTNLENCKKGLQYCL